ncbi:redoxin domain-containing protein [Comamonas sp. GB3 AK4-5]|uniref:redoxin domain-containing protein n=1 Tax=Comamonas sp. GB3 AK4-5 TaxID=3231487 RepID=UPI00351E982E
MGEVLQIGPLALPWAPLQLLGAWWVGDALAQRLAARQQQVWGLHGWMLLLCSLIVARAAFVLQYTEHYRTPVWSALDIRDGGWSAGAGVATALLYLVFLWIRRSPLLRAAAVGIASALALWLGVQALRHAMLPSNIPLPAFAAVTLQGQTLNLEQLPAQHGQPLVINLWASWCPPCRREMPAMLQAQQEHPGVRFLWVNQGEAPETVLRFAAQHQLPPSQVLLDIRQDLGRLLGSRALPTTVFVDTQGRQAALRVGELSTATLAQQLQALGVSAAASAPPSSSTESASP